MMDRDTLERIGNKLVILQREIESLRTHLDDTQSAFNSLNVLLQKINEEEAANN